eukprot:556043-Pyramimonas_sp.AAC.1
MASAQNRGTHLQRGFVTPFRDTLRIDGTIERGIIAYAEGGRQRFYKLGYGRSPLCLCTQAKGGTSMA